MSMTQKTLALLDAVSNASVNDQEGLAKAVQNLGLTGPELNELRRARIVECLAEMNALCDEVATLRAALDDDTTTAATHDAPADATQAAS